jgi:DNA replication and repair protein RecF
MKLQSLYLRQFRNYEEAYFEFDPLINVICGPNAQGKTSILEAIFFLMIGRSFRSRQPQELIKMGTDFFHIESIFNKHEIDQKMHIHYQPNERKIVHNTTQLSSMSHILGIMQGVTFTPDDADLIKGSPLKRRQFLDIQISQGNPLYLHHLIRYGKAIRQRNQLLRDKQSHSIAIWEEEMAHSAAYLTVQRSLTIATLQPCCQEFYSLLSGEIDGLELTYRSSAPLSDEKEIKEYYIQQFEKHRNREMIVGYTISGPQKDDMRIAIGGKECRHFASEGQQRTVVAALRLGEWKRLREVTGITPLFMIDDIGMSLDGNRRKRLIEQIMRMGQVFCTTTDPTLFEECTDSNNIITLPRAAHRFLAPY